MFSVRESTEREWHIPVSRPFRKGISNIISTRSCDLEASLRSRNFDQLLVRSVVHRKKRTPSF